MISFPLPATRLHVKLSISPADEVLEHGGLSRRLPADDRDLRQVYDHGHTELREDVLDLVDEGDEGLHPYVTLLRARHGGGRRVVDAAGHCKGLLHPSLSSSASASRPKTFTRSAVFFYSRCRLASLSH